MSQEEVMVEGSNFNSFEVKINSSWEFLVEKCSIRKTPLSLKTLCILSESLSLFTSSLV